MRSEQARLAAFEHSAGFRVSYSFVSRGRGIGGVVYATLVALVASGGCNGQETASTPPVVVTSCADASECPGDDTECSQATCVDGECDAERAPEGTECAEGVCDELGVCVECLANDHCDGEELCRDNKCVPRSCADGVINGDETDIDCGGDECNRCDYGELCGNDDDCRTLHCAAGVGEDGAALCGFCSENSQCKASHFCDKSTGYCVDKLANGKVCTLDRQCASGQCVDGVCCDTACDGFCETCGGYEGSFPAGTCSANPFGTDEDGDCGADYCNGYRQCACGDGARNAHETDVDCGGPACGACPPGADCGDPADCGSGVCANVCQPPRCGDGVVQDGEACDDGNEDNNDDCPDDGYNGGTCQPAVCGDGFPDLVGEQLGVDLEQCDGDNIGTAGETAECDIDCTWSACGDGLLNMLAGELCEDNNQNNNDDCPDGEGGSCAPNVCGDGFLDEEGASQEECDDGNLSNSDNCLDGDGSLCKIAACGDGYVNVAEETCDGDGAGIPGETATCDVDCSLAECGDGSVNVKAGETCDDGNRRNTDDCPDGEGGTCEPATCSDGFANILGPALKELAIDCGLTCDNECPGRLLISEFVVQPNELEFIEIHNPTPDKISLSSVYLSDSANYGLVPEGTQNLGAGDFIIKFPPNAFLAGEAYAVVALGDSAAFEAAYGSKPDYEVHDDDPAAVNMVLIDDNGHSLTNNGEVIVAFYWDPEDDLVRDIDIVLYGDDDDAVNKTGVTSGASTYLDEVGTTSFVLDPPIGESAQRCDSQEGEEIDSMGNGFIFHDETSEDVANTWIVSSDPTPGGTTSGCAVAGKIEWIRSSQGTGSESANSIHADSNGNVVVAGTFSSASVNWGGVGDELTNSGGSDVFVVKLDSDGDYVWSISASGTNNDTATRVAVDADDNIYVAGNFQSALLDWGNGVTLSQTGIQDGFLVKLTSSGVPVWAIGVLGDNVEDIRGLDVTTDGRSYITGSFKSSNFGVSILGFAASAGGADFYMAQISPAGMIENFRKYGSGLDEFGTSIATNGSHIAVTGGFNDDFSPCSGGDILTSTGATDVFTAKCDANGFSEVWHQQGVGNGLDGGADVAFDSDGDVYVTGTFQSSNFNFGGSLPNPGATDIFVSRFASADGTPVFAVRGIGTGNDLAADLDVHNGTIFLGGTFSGPTLNFGGPGSEMTNSGSDDAFVATLSAVDGSLVWSLRGDGASSDQTRGVAYDSMGTPHAAGSYGANGIDFGEPLSSGGAIDAFILRM